MQVRQGRNSQNSLDEREVPDSVRGLFVDLSRFSEMTEYWLKKKFGLSGKISVKDAANLWFLLRTTPDEEFPSGAWATIQVLEGMILEALEHATQKTENA